MHKSHQTRLTSLTNQINQQHAEQTESLKAQYESELKDLREKYEATSGNADTEKATETETLELKEQLEVIRREEGVKERGILTHTYFVHLGSKERSRRIERIL